LLRASNPQHLPEASTGDIERRLDQILLSGSVGPDLLRRLNERIARAKILFGGRPLPTFPKPHVIATIDEERWGRDAERLVDVFEKAGRALMMDRELRARLGMPAAAEALFEIDPGYSRLAVSSRFDMVWSGPEVRVLEFNADSPAMMTFTDRVEGILLGLDRVGDVLRAHGARPRNRTRALHDSMLAAYREWGGTRLDPCIALVDWSGEATADELRHTASEFTRFGSPTVVCDPRELYMVEGWLHARGRRIDIVQRRVLFPDFLRRASELATLVDAYRRGRVCMVNSLRSYVVGNKVTLAMISRDAFGFSLSDQSLVAELVPATEVVTPESHQRLLGDKDRWVLKGAFGSGGKEVTIGRRVSAPEWREALDSAARSPSVVQRLEPIPRCAVPLLNDAGQVELTELYANWNPWVFGGRYGGATTRVGWKPVVVISGGGGLMPCTAARWPTLERHGAIAVDAPLAWAAQPSCDRYGADGTD
jgi:glutathionylspermidine synthase